MNLSRLFAPIALVSAIALSGISGSALADTTLRIGVTPVPHADIVNFIKPTLEKEGVKLEVVEFNDYIQPNLALDAGELDANYFQTIPYLEEMVKSRGLNLHILVSVHLEPMALYSKKVKRLADIPAGAKVAVPSDPTNEGRALKVLEHAGLIKLKDGATLLSGIGDIDYIQPNLALDAGELDANYFQTIPYLEEMVKSRGLNLHILVSVHLEPMALYSKKVKRLADIPAGAKVAVPSDPTNEGRALKVLEHAGLIKLKDGATLLSGIGDIVSNPKKLKFVELEPALLPRALDDVTAAVINANYALEAGFNPAKNAIALEEKSSPFGNVVAIREGDDKKEAFQKLKKAIISPEVKKFIEEKYQGGVLPVF